MSIYKHFSEQEIDILRERAERVARDNTQQDLQATIAALIVTIHNEVYAVPVEYIVTIYEDVPIVPVPSARAYIRGIANLRGHITPVIDPGVLLNVPDDKTETDKYYLIVISDKSQTVALFVEGVGEIKDFSSEEITALSVESDEKSSIARGIMTSGEALVDIRAILNMNE